MAVNSAPATDANILITLSGKVIVPGTTGVTIYKDLTFSEQKFVAYPVGRSTSSLCQFSTGRIVGAGFYSDDDCETMVSLTDVTSGNVFKIRNRIFRCQYPINSTTLWSDTGISWTAVSVSASYTTVIFPGIAENVVFFIDNNVVIYKSTDGGATCSASYTLGDGYFGWVENNGSRIAISFRLRQCYTDDDGATWNRADKAANQSQSDGYVVKVGGKWYRHQLQNNRFSVLDFNDLANLNINTKTLVGVFSGQTYGTPITRIDENNWLFTGTSGSVYWGKLCAPFEAEISTSNAFSPASPAKLATLPSAVLTLDTTGAAGTVALYLQHYNDEVGRWESYEGVADDDTDASFTLIGSYDQVTNNISLPTLPARSGEMVRARLKFTSTDGTAPAPSFVSLSLSWTSDVTAPDAPTISKIISAATSIS